MFNKHKYKFISLAALVVLVGVAVPTHFAHANGAVDAISNALLTITNIKQTVVFYIIAAITTFIFHLVGFWLTMAGGLLNISMNLTLHIKDFVQNTAGVYLVWQSIRDISSLLIIFLLLYTSFRTILGIDQGVNKLIKDIIIAGILINFSFFLVGLMIDASNMVSLSVYNVIAPANATGCTVGASTFTDCSVGDLFNTSTYDGGLSSIIMQNLNITGVFNTKWMSLDITNAAATQFKIIFTQMVGITMMVLLAISFFVAAIAFIVRLVMLIFILGFSPVWFASWIFPEMKPLSDKFTKNLKSQLVFMPVYLFLLYAAIRILENIKLGSSATITPISTTASATVIAQQTLSLLINSTFVIIMINLPLMGAISVSGLSGGWIDKMASSIKSKTAGFIGRNTLGRGAAALGRSEAFKQLAAKSPLAERAAFGLTQKISSAGWGGGKGASYDQVQKDKSKALEAQAKRVGTIERGDYDLTEEGEKAFKAAKSRAKDYQKEMVGNMSWGNSRVGTILGGVLGNTTNRGTQSRLENKIKNEEIKDEKEKNIQRLEKEEVKLERLKKENSGGPGFASRNPTEEEKQKILAQEKIIEKLRSDIEKAKEIEDEEKEERLIKRLEEAAKKGGEEKPKTKASETPK